MFLKNLGFLMAALSMMFAVPATAAVSITKEGLSHGVVPSGGVMLCDGVGDCGGKLSGTYLNFGPSTIPGVAAAIPGNTTQQIAVLGGNTATLAIGKWVSWLKWDQGSNDSYGFASLKTSLGDILIPGGLFPPASGDQFISSTNFGLKVDFGKSVWVESATWGGSQNSNEFDNVIAGVPEPASWAMLIVGFGAVGTIARRRRSGVSVAA